MRLRLRVSTQGGGWRRSLAMRLLDLSRLANALSQPQLAEAHAAKAMAELTCLAGAEQAREIAAAREAAAAQENRVDELQSQLESERARSAGLEIQIKQLEAGARHPAAAPCRAAARLAVWSSLPAVARIVRRC